MNARKEKRRKEFIEVARRIINNEGYDACTVRRICAEVGVAPSSFYHCFSDKDEIVFFIGSEIDSFMKEHEKEFQGPDPRENLICFMRYYLMCVEKNGKEMCWRIHLSHHNGAYVYKHGKDRTLYILLNRIVYQGKNLWYNDLSDDEMISLIMTTLRGITFEWAREDDYEELVANNEKKLPVITRLIFKEKNEGNA